eukprot:15484557-Alexandrium_andersonii.AAC.1
MQIRAMEAPREVRRLRRPPLERGGSEFLQSSSRGEGRLARRASWDRELPGRSLRLGPNLTGGLNEEL